MAETTELGRIYARLEARQAELREKILGATDPDERGQLVKLWRTIHSGDPVPGEGED